MVETNKGYRPHQSGQRIRYQVPLFLNWPTRFLSYFVCRRHPSSAAAFLFADFFVFHYPSVHTNKSIARGAMRHMHSLFSRTQEAQILIPQTWHLTTTLAHPHPSHEGHRAGSSRVSVPEDGASSHCSSVTRLWARRIRWTRRSMPGGHLGRR